MIAENCKPGKGQTLREGGRKVGKERRDERSEGGKKAKRKGGQERGEGRRRCTPRQLSQTRTPRPAL